MRGNLVSIESRDALLDLTWTIKLFDDNFNRLATWFVGHPLLGHLSIACSCFDRKLEVEGLRRLIRFNIR